jgi:hypothetical protein
MAGPVNLPIRQRDLFMEGAEARIPRLALLRQLVDVGGGNDLVAVATDAVPTLVVDQNENDVGLGGWLRRFSGGERAWRRK